MVQLPSLFKKWLDEVLTHGWAYGSKSGYKVSGKKIALALSVGIDEQEYRPSEKYKYTLEELTRPFELTFEYIKSGLQAILCILWNGAQCNGGMGGKEVLPMYLDFLEGL